jgi:hypothetical protein
MVVHSCSPNIQDAEVEEFKVSMGNIKTPFWPGTGDSRL